MTLETGRLVSTEAAASCIKQMRQPLVTGEEALFLARSPVANAVVVTNARLWIVDMVDGAVGYIALHAEMNQFDLQGKTVHLTTSDGKARKIRLWVAQDAEALHAHLKQAGSVPPPPEVEEALTDLGPLASSARTAAATPSELRAAKQAQRSARREDASAAKAAEDEYLGKQGGRPLLRRYAGAAVRERLRVDWPAQRPQGQACRHSCVRGHQTERVRLLGRRGFS